MWSLEIEICENESSFTEYIKLKTTTTKKGHLYVLWTSPFNNPISRNAIIIINLLIKFLMEPVKLSPPLLTTTRLIVNGFTQMGLNFEFEYQQN